MQKNQTMYERSRKSNFFRSSKRFLKRRFSKNYSKDSVTKYYEDCNVLVTGGSGFLGKVLVEKLLRSCDGIKTIFILMRPKRNLCVQERFEQFLNSHAFQRIRFENPKLINKLRLMAGDLTEPFLALTLEDYRNVRENINVVFNVDSVRYNESLPDALNLNAFGAHRVLQMCSVMKNLKSVVHVSSAYCNPQFEKIPESICPMILPDKWYRLSPNDELLISSMEKELVNHPNTYTLSKSVAEQAVLEYSEKLPICVVRPSIIVGAEMEPFEGWVEGINEVTMFTAGVKYGMFGSIRGSKNHPLDVIPVDILANTLIIAASKNHANNLKVYNCTSSSINPITLEEYFNQVPSHTNYEGMPMILRNKPVINSFNFLHKLHRFFFNYLLFFLYDLFLWIRGSNPILIKECLKFHRAADSTEYLTRYNWIFEVENYKSLIQSSRNQKSAFNCDIGQLKWDQFIEKSVKGIDKFVLKNNSKNNTN